MNNRRENPILKLIIASLLCVVYFTSASVIAAQPGSTLQSSEAMGEIYKGYGVSEAVRAGDFLYIGGIVAFNEDGSVHEPYNGPAQVQMVYARIEKLLKASGATYKNVISETVYAPDFKRLIDGLEIRKKFYDAAGAAYPTMAGIEVSALSSEGLVLEVEIVAYLGE